jgi:hypothetical protein
MSPWQLDALDLCREARARATETSNTALHQACARALEALASEGGSVPLDLRIYARTVRLLHGIPMAHVASSASVAYVE